MIKYKFPEEKEIALHYARLLNDKEALLILEKNYVENKTEAKALASFYWAMVNKTVEEDHQGIKRNLNDIDMWLEYLCNTFYIYLSNEGYENEWEEN